MGPPKLQRRSDRCPAVVSVILPLTTHERAHVQLPRWCNRRVGSPVDFNSDWPAARTCFEAFCAERVRRYSARRRRLVLAGRDELRTIRHHLRASSAGGATARDWPRRGYTCGPHPNQEVARLVAI